MPPCVFWTNTEVPEDGPDIIALTGATGFVGKVVLQDLLARGYLVKALIRPGSAHKGFAHKNINWIEGELGNPHSEAALCAGAKAVIHMAGLITARTKTDYMRINAAHTGTLAAAAGRAGVGRFIYLSSLTARAPGLSDYAASKRAGEGAFARSLAAAKHGMKGVVVRAPAVFGAGDKATAPFYTLIRKGILPAPGGRNWRARKLSLVHVDDLAAFLSGPCLEGGCDGRTVSVATKACLSWPEFAEECQQALGWHVRAVPLPLSVLYPIAAVNTLSKRFLGVGHLTLGKLREFLHPDWCVKAEYEVKTPLQSALKKTIVKAI